MAEPRRVNHAETLRKVPVFSGLEEHELQFLAQRAVPRHYSAGEIVFNEGDPCGGMYVVEAGNVRIFKSSASGREQVLAIEGAGSSIAELPVFDGGNYPALLILAFTIIYSSLPHLTHFLHWFWLLRGSMYVCSRGSELPLFKP